LFSKRKSKFFAIFTRQPDDQPDIQLNVLEVDIATHVGTYVGKNANRLLPSPPTPKKFLNPKRIHPQLGYLPTYIINMPGPIWHGV
jgi:hypothetical protein